MKNNLPKEGWYVENDGSKKFNKIMLDWIYKNDVFKGMPFNINDFKVFGKGVCYFFHLYYGHNYTKLSLDDFIELSKAIKASNNHTLDAFFYAYRMNSYMIWGMDFGLPDSDETAKGKYMVFPNKEIIEELKKYKWNVKYDPTLQSSDKLVHEFSFTNDEEFKRHFTAADYALHSNENQKVETLDNYIHKDTACVMFEELANKFTVYAPKMGSEILTDFLDSHNLPYDGGNTSAIDDNFKHTNVNFEYFSVEEIGAKISQLLNDNGFINTTIDWNYNNPHGRNETITVESCRMKPILEH